MATEEHKRLADIVKGTHASLRTEYQQYGAEVAWKRHMARNDVLQKYATSMQKLATKYWKDNDSKNGTYCRMLWIRTQCKEYFLNGGKEKYDKKELDISIKMTGKRLDENCTSKSDDIHIEDRLRNCHEQKISVLDVGSCYNPLSVDEAFDVTAIDLIPDLTEGIFRCDFLNVAIGVQRILSRDAREIQQLPARSFDAVVFSLLLEYLPCPKQRYVCCRNAYDVLKIGGLLIIVSPDSKHVGANARLMKAWRYTLSKLGFMRIKYEKLRHIHCLMFRKCACKDVATRWCELQRFSQDDRKYISETEIFIPQDFQAVCPEEEGGEKSDEYDETDLANIFSELPFDNEALV